MVYKNHPIELENNTAFKSIKGIETLFNELHEQGKVLRWRSKKIYFVLWLRAFITRKMAQLPCFKINFNLEDERISENRIMASDEQLETIFENLFSNSVRAITVVQIKKHSFIGKIDITVGRKEKSLEVIFTDNGAKYDTVSGRGINQIETEMQSLKGEIHINKNPYQTQLVFPIAEV
ncbi:MAG: hypothetical protein COX19_15605 [Desulfobacterales bacterium CG23_combo_of_CG06-09_8_20_14_all_51_8]|nr:MAG: hypothetical protein COX19_15605 [Desulfobacterales bacterium CG23_combo_of_CG06-09_8_20_14_all_51_8]